MPALGLSGTVGSGKSTVLRILEDLGAEGIEADRIGHELLGEPEIVDKVAALLGDGVRGKEGELNRSRIREMVFSDAAVLEEYNNLLHPPLLDRIKEWLDRPREENRVAVVAAALIPEWGIESWFDEVWCVVCSDEVALSRWEGPKEHYWQIRKAQFAPERKLAKAGRIVENERSKESLRRSTEESYEEYRKARCP